MLQYIILYTDSYIKGIYRSGQQTKPVNGVTRYLIGTHKKKKKMYIFIYNR